MTVRMMNDQMMTVRMMTVQSVTAAMGCLPAPG